MSFVLEPIQQALGGHALYHGAHFDVRWKSPVYADTVITPQVQVTAVTRERITLEGLALQEDGATAMTVQVVIPLP